MPSSLSPRRLAFPHPLMEEVLDLMDLAPTDLEDPVVQEDMISTDSSTEVPEALAGSSVARTREVPSSSVARTLAHPKAGTTVVETTVDSGRTLAVLALTDNKARMGRVAVSMPLPGLPTTPSTTDRVANSKGNPVNSPSNNSKSPHNSRSNSHKRTNKLP